MSAFALALILILIALMLWGILGGASPSTGTNGSTPNGGGGCTDCKQLKAWWNGLSGLQKIKQAVYYAARKSDCFLRGC